MAVASTKPYIGVSRDSVANFNGKQIVYVCWDHHLLFASTLMFCVEPEMQLGDFLRDTVKPLLESDPDCAALDFGQAEWKKAKTAWTPDFNTSLAANGIRHKELLRFHTPGLNSLGISS
ncbi:MAG: phenol hydroxylase subunit P4 [Azonexus sp.]|jgi:phenol hydroxylase P4 protein|nr:phenol hydroxylase subunit P4 [Azonexus sp.]